MSSNGSLDHNEDGSDEDEEHNCSEEDNFSIGPSFEEKIEALATENYAYEINSDDEVDYCDIEGF